MYLNPKFIKTIPANVEGRDFVVGDLHGCFEELGKLLMHVKFDPIKDRLFSTGDLVDRGPRSQDCLGLLTKKWFFAVLGNHEDLVLNKLKSLEMGENNTIKPEEVVYLKSLAKYIPYILEMPLVYEVEHLLLGKIYIVHSEILPEHLYGFDDDELDTKEYKRYLNTMKKFDFSQQIIKFFNAFREKDISYTLKQKLLWSRKIVSAFYKDNKESIDNSDFAFMKSDRFIQKTKIFCGHNVVPFPMKIGQQYYIDTGAALGYSNRDVSNYLFSQFGHEFFTLSMVDMTTGICYGCVTSGENKGKIFKLGESLYK